MLLVKLQQSCGKILARGLLCSQSHERLQPRISCHGPFAFARCRRARVEQVTVTARQAGAEEGFFHHMLDVVNPLQHLPIIGTIYRAITGEQMGPVEKITGDALYGGMWGAVSSVADVAFKGITGKSFEDTVLALFKSDSTKAGSPVPKSLPTSRSLLSMPSLPDCRCRPH